MIARLASIGTALTLAASVSAFPAVNNQQIGSDGCGIDHHVGFNNNNTHGFYLGDRTYAVLIPHGYDANRSYPLIVDYHGRYGTFDSQFNTSRYDVFDTNGDFVVVYPQGVGHSWEGASYHDDNVDDLKFTTDLVQHMRDNYCIDSDRVYASGKSNGGGFVGTLACSDEGKEFAAFALSSPALYTDNLGASSGDWGCSPSRSPIPIMEVHGSADQAIYYSGGKGGGGTTPPIPDWLNAWGIDRDGGDGPHSDYPSSEYGSRVNVTTYTVDQTPTVTGIWIKDMDHCWASTIWNYDWEKHSAENCSSPLNATTIYLDYFNLWDINGLRSN